MVSKATDVLLTVIIFASYGLSSCFVTFNINGSDLSLDTRKAYLDRYFAWFIRNNSTNHIYAGEYPNNGSVEYPSTQTALTGIAIENGTNVDSRFEDDCQEADIDQGEWEVQWPGRHTSKVETNGSENVRGDAPTRRTLCKRRFVLPNEHADWSPEHIPYGVFNDITGIPRNLAVSINGIGQSFMKDKCSQVHSCANCQHCTCRLDYVYQQAIYTEGKDSAGNDILNFGSFKFPHVCRCINY